METFSQWTTETPTVPGLYWVWHEGFGVEIADVQGDTARRQWVIRALMARGGFALREEDDYTHWIGPLNVPDPPKVD